MRNHRRVRLFFLGTALLSYSWGYSQTFVPASNNNNSNNGQPAQFPQLQGNPFGNSGINNAAGSQAVMPTLSNPAAPASPAQKPGAAVPMSKSTAPSFPQIAPASSPKSFVPGYHPVIPIGMPSAMSGGSGGYGGNRSAGGTDYSPAPSYNPPARSVPPPSSNVPKPSSVVIPNVPANAQKVNPTYVQPNSNANAGSMGSSSPQTIGSSSLTPQSCVATGVCK
jgi:hypothetical protein